MDVVVFSAARYWTLRPLQFLTSVEKWKFILWLYCISRKRDGKLCLLPREFRHRPKTEFVTLRLVAACVILGLLPHKGKGDPAPCGAITHSSERAYVEEPRGSHARPQRHWSQIAAGPGPC